ncbi:MAG: aspartate aminotransferase family protein [Curvibacter sp.]
MYKDLDAYWMPCTANRQFTKAPRMLARSSGMHYWYDKGRQILDGVAGLWCVNAGHARPRIVQAIQDQAAELDFAPSFQMAHPKAFELADRIVKLAPEGMSKVFFTNSGSEAVETALKMAIAYHRARGEGTRTRLIGRERGYHGVGFGGISVGGIPANRKTFSGAMLPRVDHLRFIHDPVKHAFYNGVEPVWDEDLLLELEQRILPLHDPSNVAAVIVEPVAGSAGWYVPPQGYLKRLREICDRHGILLIFDEVITGFGRLGTPFGADYYGVVPDLLTFAKCVTNGVIPLGGVLCRQGIFDAVMDAHRDSPAHQIEFFHGYTYSGHPVACAAAVATLDLMRDEDLFARAGRMGQVLGDVAHGALRGLPHVVSLRSLGLATAIELESRAGLPGQRAYEVFLDCLRQGVLVRAAGESIVLAPAYVVEPQQIAQMVDAVATALRRLA